MESYLKINSVFKRDSYVKKHKGMYPLIFGNYSTPEIEFLKTCQFRFEEKMDGTNIRIIWDGSRIRFKGRKEKSQIPGSLLSFLEDTYYPKEKDFQDKFGKREICLYSEGCGPGIGKAGKNFPDYASIIFDIKIRNWWLQRKEIEEICDDLNLTSSKIVKIGTIDDIIDIVKNGFNSGFSNENNTFEAEGVVGKPIAQIFDRRSNLIYVKLKKRDFKYYYDYKGNLIKG
jgi:hypothetical protein